MEIHVELKKLDNIRMKKKLNCILLADDNTADNFFHMRTIQKMDITENIEVALDGAQALEFIKKATVLPDIIFLDINMPRVNGWEFMRVYEQLSSQQKSKAVIVMLTTSENPEDKERAREFPDISSFNSKPLTKEMINQILSEHFPDYL